MMTETGHKAADGQRSEPEIAADCTVEAGDWPSREALVATVNDALVAASEASGYRPAPGSEVGVLFTDDAHMRALNARWRGKDRPTNVLSFPSTPAGGAPPLLLGDIVLAFETIAREAAEEEKPFDHHLAHLVVHGFLHILGYDHETSKDAEIMEALERRALSGLAIRDPYA